MTETNEPLITILWVHDNFDGPMNGLCYLNDNIEDPLWFSRLYIDQVTEPRNEQEYALYRLPNLPEVEDLHQRYCLETGAPLKHGDPIRMKRRNRRMERTDF